MDKPKTVDIDVMKKEEINANDLSNLKRKFKKNGLKENGTIPYNVDGMNPS